MEKGQNMQVGDIVKSYDFHGRTDCYMLGRVVSISKLHGDFRAEYLGRVFAGNVDKKFKTDFFTAPLQGNAMFDEVFPDFQRVEVVA